MVKIELEDEVKNKQKQLEDHLGIPVRTIKPGIRFIHLIIDIVAMIALTYIVDMIPSINTSWLYTLLYFPLYFIFFEYHFQRTTGKFISNTIVIDSNGERPDIKTIVLRTFARFVPFEPISCLAALSCGWHDRWTGTYVIEKEDLSELREIKGLDSIEVTPLKFSKVTIILIAVFLFLIIASSDLIKT